MKGKITRLAIYGLVYILWAKLQRAGCRAPNGDRCAADLGKGSTMVGTYLRRLFVVAVAASIAAGIACEGGSARKKPATTGTAGTGSSTSGGAGSASTTGSAGTGSATGAAEPVVLCLLYTSDAADER